MFKQFFSKDLLFSWFGTFLTIGLYSEQPRATDSTVNHLNMAIPTGLITYNYLLSNIYLIGAIMVCTVTLIYTGLKIIKFLEENNLFKNGSWRKIFKKQ
jgi:hypothetical protein